MTLTRTCQIVPNHARPCKEFMPRYGSDPYLTRGGGDGEMSKNRPVFAFAGREMRHDSGLKQNWRR